MRRESAAEDAAARKTSFGIDKSSTLPVSLSLPRPGNSVGLLARRVCFRFTTSNKNNANIFEFPRCCRSINQKSEWRIETQMRRVCVYGRVGARESGRAAVREGEPPVL